MLIVNCHGSALKVIGYWFFSPSKSKLNREKSGCVEFGLGEQFDFVEIK